jgi:hypothetical protein
MEMWDFPITLLIDHEHDHDHSDQIYEREREFYASQKDIHTYHRLGLLNLYMYIHFICLSY